MSNRLNIATLESLGANGFSLGTKELLAYQAFTHAINLRPSKQASAQLSGGYLSRIKGRGMEFDEARHYQPGDDIRAIDWRVTARTGKTHTKVYREERERPVFLLCDFRSPMYFGTQYVLKSVQCAHLASLIAWSAVSRGDKVGAVVFNNDTHAEIKPMSRKRAVLSLTHALVNMHGRTQTSLQQQQLEHEFEQACLRIRRLAKPGSLVYLLSDFNQLSGSAVQHIGQLKRHCEVQAISLFDPFEMTLPSNIPASSITLSDGQHKCELNIGDKAVASSYAEIRNSATCQVSELLTPNVTRLQRISAGESLVAQLITQQGGEA